jgi:hypothetical protein
MERGAGAWCDSASCAGANAGAGAGASGAVAGVRAVGTCSAGAGAVGAAASDGELAAEAIKQFTGGGEAAGNGDDDTSQYTGSDGEGSVDAGTVVGDSAASRSLRRSAFFLFKLFKMSKFPGM